MSTFSSAATAASTPSTLSKVAGVAEGIGAFGNAAGSWFSARNQQTNLRYQAQAADVNAKIAELAAESAIFAGQRREQSVRLRGAQTKASQRASFAANGIDLASRTVLDILTSTDVLTEVDANTVAANTAREAWGYRTQATNFAGDAAMGRVAANNVSPFAAAGSTLLTDASRIGRRWRDFETGSDTTSRGQLDRLGG